MMTHTSPELRRGLHLTRHTTSQITVTGPSQPFKIRMFSEDDIQAAVRSAEPEAFAECSFRVSLHFSPALAAVRRSVPDSGWPTVTMGQIQISRHRDGGQTSWYSDDDDVTQWWWWHVGAAPGPCTLLVIRTAGVLCCELRPGVPCAPGHGAIKYWGRLHTDLRYRVSNFNQDQETSDSKIWLVHHWVSLPKHSM